MCQKVAAGAAIEIVKNITERRSVVILSLLLIILYMYCYKNFKIPLAELQDYASRVSNGDLDIKLSGKFVAELAVLKGAIERMVFNLKKKDNGSRRDI